MGKVFSCRDVGVDCNFTARGETEQEVLQQTEEHARKDHDISVIPAEMAEKIHAAIRDEAA